jgi:hypothetical protein
MPSVTRTTTRTKQEEGCIAFVLVLVVVLVNCIFKDSF